MTAPREVLPNTTYLITRRCSERRFFLKPLQIVTQAFGYLVAVVAGRYGIQVHAACVLSNHYHLVITDPKATLPHFVQELNGSLARFLNRLYHRKESVFPPGSYSAVELADEESVLEGSAYVLANPAMAALVVQARQWPGLWSAPEEIGGAPRTFERPKLFFDPKGAMPAVATLRFTVPRGFEREPFRKALTGRVEARERVAAEVLKAAKRKPLGVRKIMAQSPNGRPTAEDKPSGRKNGFSAAKKEVAEAVRERRKAFQDAYRAALHAFQDGKRWTRFPLGTFLMRVHLMVACAAAG